jgi:hypothetical protein
MTEGFRSIGLPQLVMLLVIVLILFSAFGGGVPRGPFSR